MRNLIYVAAVLAIGGFSFVGCNKDEAKSGDNPPAQTPGQKIGGAIDSTTQKVANAATQVGAAISPTGANNLDGAKKAIEGVAEKATSKNDFKDVAGYLTKADEDRIVKTKPDTKDIDDQIDAFNKAWKAKYNYDFKIKDLTSEYPDTFLAVAQDSSDPNKATATFLATHGMSELKVPFVREGSLWKIDVPDEVDGAKLHDNLLAALTKLNAGAAAWPDNDGDAAQAVTYGILSAVLNK